MTDLLEERDEVVAVARLLQTELRDLGCGKDCGMQYVEVRDSNGMLCCLSKALDYRVAHRAHDDADLRWNQADANFAQAISEFHQQCENIYIQ